MFHRKTKTLISALSALALLGAASAALADPAGPEHSPQGAAHGPMAAARPERAPARVEPHPGPSGYPRIAEPPGWNRRPEVVDRPTYQHNFQAARRYGIGPYHPPRGWRPHRWVYGDILPRAYWAAPYVIADYWLFALEIPPAGCEWVRVGSDAVLVDMRTGEVLETVYDLY